ncbi:MAG: cation diffusion facilitator family transporter [Patescibacteria group bacterium]|nr:cation diffusion facilitator family transporter [Patescibacteria group bacterium]
MELRQTAGFVPVALAIAGNAFVTVIKFAAALASGSSVMLSEAVHSTADTLNQVLLLIGLRRSLKKPDEEFEYGYGNERFFWALISACGVFFVGAGVTVYQGVTALVHPEPIEFSSLIFIVLVVALLVETYTFYRAALELRTHTPDVSWRERVRHADPATLAVYLEDAVAVLGVLIAAVAIALSYITGSSTWDAWGSIAIGALLAVTAIVLIVKNRAYLVGRVMPEEMQRAVRAIIAADPAVEKIVDFKSATMGFGVYRIKFELELNGSALLQSTYRDAALRAEYEEVNDDFEAFKKFCVDYADRIPRLIGRKVDEWEAVIKKRYPGVRHIDIEVN